MIIIEALFSIGFAISMAGISLMGGSILLHTLLPNKYKKLHFTSGIGMGISTFLLFVGVGILVFYDYLPPTMKASDSPLTVAAVYPEILPFAIGSGILGGIFFFLFYCAGRTYLVNNKEEKSSDSYQQPSSSK